MPRDQKVENKNTDTLVFNKPPTELLKGRPPPRDAVQNVYELRSQRELVRYYYAAAGFLTKATWIEAINNGHYASWPGLTARAVSKHFPESEETQKGHMKKQKAGIRSTKRELMQPSDQQDKPT